MSRRSVDKGFKRLADSNLSLFGSLTLLTVVRMGIAELLGTGLLVMLGCMGPVMGLPGAPSPHLLVGWGFGIAVMIVIQIIGHISKAHINPAVTVGLVIFGDINIPLAIVYIICQCIGSTLGYGILITMVPGKENEGLCVTQVAPTITALQGLLTEVVITAALILVVCGVFDWRNSAKEDSVPIRFGLAVAGLAMVGGPFTGASMNPARSLGPVIWTNIWKQHWVYWVGPLTGAVIASLFYRCVFMVPKPEPEMEPVDRNFEQELPLTAIQSDDSNQMEK